MSVAFSCHDDARTMAAPRGKRSTNCIPLKDTPPSLCTTPVQLALPESEKDSSGACKRRSTGISCMSTFCLFNKLFWQPGGSREGALWACCDAAAMGSKLLVANTENLPMVSFLGKKPCGNGFGRLDLQRHHIGATRRGHATDVSPHVRSSLYTRSNSKSSYVCTNLTILADSI